MDSALFQRYFSYTRPLATIIMKHREVNILILFLISANFLFSQKVSYNHLVNSTDVETKKVIELFENYLKSDPSDLKTSKYWNSAELKDHKKFDFLESEFQPSLYMGLPVHVLSIKSKDGLYAIKAQFSYCKEDGTPYVLAIVNYYAQRENNDFKLFNALTINRATWKCSNVGLVDYYHPDYHKFNFKKAIKLNEFINDVAKNFDINPIPFEYYLADDYDEIQALKGIDYYIGMGGTSKPTGKATDDKVYCSGLGENYPHEVFHLQVDKNYPNKHFWVSEGIATFIGGSRGKELNWHIKRLNDYLSEHPEINLNNLLQLKNFDEFTSYHYALGGLIAKNIFEKGSWSMVRAFMNSGKTDEDYYSAIEQYLGIERTDLNSYLRAQLKINAEK